MFNLQNEGEPLVLTHLWKWWAMRENAEDASATSWGRIPIFIESRSRHGISPMRDQRDRPVTKSAIAIASCDVRIASFGGQDEENANIVTSEDIES